MKHVIPKVCLAAMLLGCATTQTATGSAVVGEPRTELDQYNTRHQLGLHGYDPVSYFPEGGGAPAPGAESNALEYRGIVYRFASSDNRAAFEAEPAKYEPAYGGWCAWAMAGQGKKVNPNPHAYVIQGGRLMLFYKTGVVDTLAKWQAGDTAALEHSADEQWAERLGAQ